MATAAPAAPSPAAAPQPQAAPAPDAGKPAEAQPRKIAPIPPPDAKPKKSAPPDVHLGFQKNSSSLTGEEDLIPELPRRDPDTGRFITKSERQAKDEAALRREFGKPELPEGMPPEEPGEKPVETKTPELPPAEAAKLVFLGKEYKQIGDIEHLHKTLQGLHSKAIEERDYGYRAAAAWEAEARRLGYGKTPATAQAPTQEPPKAAELTAEALVAGVDGKAFEVVMAREGLPAAIQFLGHEILSTVLQKVVPHIREQMASEYGPLKADAQASQAEQAMRAQGESSAEALAGLQGTDGKAAFPEVHDARTMSELGELAARLVADPRSGRSAQYFVTPQGMMELIAFYRMLKGFAPDQPAVLPQGNPSSLPTAVPSNEAPGAAALVSVDPGTSTPSNSGRQAMNPNMSPLDRRMARSLSDTQLVDSHLGFRKNPRNF